MSIYLEKPNPYGYRLDIRHPLVEKLYWRYKDKHHIPRWCPMSDEERLDFEAQVVEWWEGRKRGHERGRPAGDAQAGLQADQQ